MRVLLLILQGVYAAAALAFCALGGFLLSEIPRLHATFVQTALMVVVAVSAPAGAVCTVVRARLRYLTWVKHGRQHPREDRLSHVWGRAAKASWAAALTGMALLAASFLLF